jgi:hypothetical protein
MPRQIVGKGLRFSLRHAPYAHICRYCLISESRKRSALPFARFEQLVHRFYDWKETGGRNDFTIGIFVGPSFDYDLEILKGVARLHARCGSKHQILNLGGLRRRDGDLLEAWLEERRAAGIGGFHTGGLRRDARPMERTSRGFRIPDDDTAVGRRARHGA